MVSKGKALGLDKDNLAGNELLNQDKIVLVFFFHRLI
jgi:hypothetical protein